MVRNLLRIGYNIYVGAMALPLALRVHDIWVAYAELRWRKCAEEMPEEGAPVLFSDGKRIYKGCWTTWDGGHSDFSYETVSGWVEDGSEESFDFKEIKYWRPLPKAPEDNK